MFDTQIPIDPPAEYFTIDTTPGVPWDKIRVDTAGPTPGRIWGTVAPVGVALQDGLGGTWTIDELYAADRNLDFVHQGTTHLEDGTTIDTGNISGFGGHINPSADLAEAFAHYMGDANTRLARVRYGWQFDETGVLVGLVASGVVWPDRFDPLTAAIANAHPSSMDARWLVQRYDPHKNGRHVLAGSCLVNQAGLPFARGGIVSHDERMRYAIAAAHGITADAEEQSTLEKAKTDAARTHRAAWDKYQSTVVEARKARDAAIASIPKTDPDRQVKTERVRADYAAAKQSAGDERRSATRKAAEQVRVARKESAQVAREQKKTVDTKTRATKKKSRAKRREERNFRAGERGDKKQQSGYDEKQRQITKAARERRRAIYQQFAGVLAATPAGQKSAVYRQRSQALAQLREQVKQERAAVRQTKQGANMMGSEIKAGDEVTFDGDTFEVVEALTVGGVDLLRLDDDRIVAVDDVELVDGEETPADAADVSAVAAAGDPGVLDSMSSPDATDQADAIAVLNDRLTAVEGEIEALKAKTAAPVVDFGDLATFDDLAAQLS